MNYNSPDKVEATSPILLVPYMWIGDFVRCHTVVQLLRQRWPQRPIDLLTSQNNAPLLHYMPGVRKGIVCDLPRGRLPLGQYRMLAARLRSEGYGTALVMLRTWKAALAPFLAGIPERVGFVGEARFMLLNDLRWGERRLPRMIDRCAALALPADAPLPPVWPEPALVVPPEELAGWKAGLGVSHEVYPIVALAPGAVGPGKRWPTACFAELARRLAKQGAAIWVVGSPAETPLAKEIAEAAGPRVARSHRARSAQCHHRAQGSGRGRNKRFRPHAHRRRAADPHGRALRSHRPAPLGPPQPARRYAGTAEKWALPALRQVRLRRRAPPPHRGYFG